jgi:hypothetical protein
VKERISLSSQSKYSMGYGDRIIINYQFKTADVIREEMSGSHKETRGTGNTGKTGKWKFLKLQFAFNKFKSYGKYCKRQRLYDSKIVPNVQQNSVPIVQTITSSQFKRFFQLQLYLKPHFFFKQNIWSCK